MSFRSRSRTVQPVVQRRSLSGSRLPNNLSSYTSNRPLSSAYPSSTSYATSNYISPYTSVTSRDSIYSSIPSTRNSYYNGSSSSSRRDSYNGSSTIYKNPYTSDRYISPYTSYDNGITTAGLSIKSSAYGSTNGYTTNGYGSSSSSASTKNPYTPLNRHSAKILSASNTSLNSYASKPSTANAVSNTNLGRSQSFRDQTSERKSRNNLRRNSSLKSERSLSVSSEKSEGYESGSEKTSTRSRLGSSSSITSEQSPVADNSENGGEAIDYKALYEAARSDNDKLKNQLKKKDDDLMNARAAIDRFTNATTKNTLSELEKREKRAMERKISEMEEELKQLDVLKTENQRLRDENGALIRVISKLSK
ncbi:protein phosphatase 1 regulatory subunit 12A isoform X20 [Sitodiplosis mosellana]|uniref:protein phosphatase 1 regulatory subunit 12A isoform X20 n=1 Tax=Sitodiplosis mosellana TaxID=263140 RepID=UPI0024438EAE|nr:protein phosphatase 1 regulatory subunit 12A isoform X20 [Sitodiplosis mosellana]